MKFRKISPFFLFVITTFVFGIFILTRIYPLQKLSPYVANNYQAVFLTNGQVYFGKLNGLSTFIGNNLILTDVYYLQQSTQQASAIPDTKKTTQEKTSASPELSLIKLGSELHGPEDRLVINRSSVLFYEDLKKNSQVVTAIDRFRK